MGHEPDETDVVEHPDVARVERRRASASEGVGSTAGVFAKHPAVAPPGWDPEKTESGTGLTERRAVFVLPNVDDPIYEPVQAGFHDAIHQYGWTGSVEGPSAGTARDPAAQADIIESEVDRMAAGDVIVTTIEGDEAYNDAIQAALNEGIVVVNGHTTPPTRGWNYGTMQETFTYTSPVNREERGMIIPHVGTVGARGGAAMAAEAHDRLRRRFPDREEYTVLLIDDLPDIPQVSRRVDKTRAEEGTAQRYFEAQEDVRLYDDQVFTTPQAPQIATSRTFIVDNIQGENVDALVSSAFWSAVGAGHAVDEGELDGPMVIGSFDVIGSLLSGIRNGRVDFTLGQDLYSQGYQSVSTAWAYLERGIPPKDLEWGFSVWDENNAAFGSKRQSWADLVDWQRDNYGGIE